MIVTLLAQLKVRDRASESSCVEDNGFCPSWIADNLDRYKQPLIEHIELTLIAVVDRVRDRLLAGPARAPAPLAGPADHADHRHPLHAPERRGLLPAAAADRAAARSTALIALVSYSLLIIFRNVITGLDGVPAEARDAGRGMGLTQRQLLWRVEVPLALPEIMAGLRIAVTTTVGLTALVFLAGAGGLGEAIFADTQFRSNVVVAGGLCVLLAVVLDLLVLGVQKALTPWTRAAAR